MFRKAFGRVDAETSAQIDLFLKENVWASDVSMYQSIKMIISASRGGNGPMSD